MNILYRNNEYIIGKGRDGYVVINTKGKYENHSHFKYSFKAAKKCIYLVQKQVIPKYSLYMVVACMRITTNEKYLKKLTEYIGNHKLKQKCIKRKYFMK